MAVIPALAWVDSADAGVGLRPALRRAVSYLEASQLPTGQFPSEMCEGPQMSRCRAEAAIFGTTFVVGALSWAERAGEAPDVAVPKRRALRFLRSQMEAGGLWRYWTADDPMHDQIPPDLDDTSCVSALLHRHGIPFPDNRELLRTFADGRGLFQTWIGHDEPIDCLVNANVLYYFALRGEELSGVCDELNRRAAVAARPGCSAYYEPALAFAYFVTRTAVEGGARCLQPAVDALRRALPSLEVPADPLSEALALGVAVQLGSCGDPERALAARLAAGQLPDGSWPARPFFRGPGPSYFGSAALTTAMAAEALAKALHRCGME